MTATMDVICLGVGHWDGGLTVVGHRADGGGWVRLVAPERAETVACEHAELTGGGRPQPLDVLRVPVGEAAPMQHQQENVRLPTGAWSRVDRRDAAAVATWLDDPRALGRRTDSSGDGQNDRIPELYTLFMAQSVALVRPDEAQLTRIAPTRATPTGTRVIFQLDGRRYNLPVTDAAVLADGGPAHGTAWTAPLLCVVISAPAHEGYSYRHVAGLIPAAA